ncbi:MAG TPA: TetR family transcriptional regulator [Hyphomicrobiaceae bacterium]|jgi:AcrR family transcriptional regulator
MKQKRTALELKGRKRNPARTREAILKAAVGEFCRNGFTGARVEAISTRSGTNMRLLYHYFGDKEGLYTAVLERVYTQIRAEERRLDLGKVEPVEGMARLIDFTFRFFAAHPDYIALLNNENMLRGRFVRKSRAVRPLTLPLLAIITDLLERGRRSGAFRAGVDPIQLYVSITALSYFHVSNRFTLSAMFGQDLSDPGWIELRRAHAQELTLAWLADPAVAKARGRLPQTVWGTDSDAMLTIDKAARRTRK